MVVISSKSTNFLPSGSVWTVSGDTLSRMGIWHLLIVELGNRECFKHYGQLYEVTHARHIDINDSNAKAW